MFALPGYDAFLGFLLIAAAVPALALITNKLVAPKSRAGERQLTYESGMEPIGGAWIQFNIRYYMFALVFVIFDVETVFLYPWAVAFNRLGLLAFIEALIFIVIQAGEDDVLAEVVGDRWSTNRTAAGFAQVANGSNGGGCVLRHDQLHSRAPLRQAYAKATSRMAMKIRASMKASRPRRLNATAQG